jgi:hypothetical protein
LPGRLPVEAKPARAEEGAMAKKKEKKKLQFKVDFKGLNAKLKTTRKELEKIQKKVTKKDQKSIRAHIRAIKVLLGPCNPILTNRPPMSARFSGK